MTTIPLLGQRKIVYENPYQQIYRVSADFGTFTKEYFVNDYGRKGGILIIQKERILLVGQYRLLVNQLSWEIPGGKVDDNESPESAAIRETLEETGLKCRNLQPLLTYQGGMDIVSTPTFIFYTSDFKKVKEFTPCKGEVETQEWFPLAKCIEMIFTGKLVDQFSIIALLGYWTIKNRNNGPF